MDEKMEKIGRDLNHEGKGTKTWKCGAQLVNVEQPGGYSWKTGPESLQGRELALGMETTGWELEEKDSGSDCSWRALER